MPSPIVVEPSGNFLGDDGLWSTANIEVGTPPQTLQVLPSTQIQPTWVVVRDGCTIDDPSNCTKIRGGIFDNDESSSYEFVNNFALGAESNLGMTQNFDNGAFAFDVLGVITPDVGNVSVAHQVVAGIATKDFFVGQLGLSPLGINFTDQADPKPSFLSTLRAQNLIPSLSYGFTAGAFYKDRANLSLTLGGYDSAKFKPNDVSFSFGSASSRQLTVALNRITYSGDGAETSLLDKGILILIDSTVPDIWLPADVCDLFEKAFGISYNPVKNLYLVNDTLHDDLVRSGASVTFELSNDVNAGPSTNITLPYAAFDLHYNASHPLAKEQSYYFPLRRAKDETQHTLGRVILQETYIVVDHERGSFSVSETLFDKGTRAQIVAIDPPKPREITGGIAPGSSAIPSDVVVVRPSDDTEGSRSFPVGAIAGIAIAAVIITLICGTLAICYNLKKRRRRASAESSELPADPPYPKGRGEIEGTNVSDAAPLDDAATIVAGQTSGGTRTPEEVNDDDLEKDIGANDTNNLMALGQRHELDDGFRRVELPSPDPWLRPELESPGPALLRPERSTPELGFHAEPSPFPSPPLINESDLGSSSWLPIQNAPSHSFSSTRPLAHGRQGSQESYFSRDVISPLMSPNLGSPPFTPLPNPPSARQDTPTLPTGASSNSHEHPSNVSPPSTPFKRPPNTRMDSIESQDSGISDPSTVGGASQGASSFVSPIHPPVASTSSPSSSRKQPKHKKQQHQPPQPSQPQSTQQHPRPSRPTLTQHYRMNSWSSLDNMVATVSEAQAIRRESIQSAGRAREVEIVNGRESPATVSLMSGCGPYTPPLPSHRHTKSSSGSSSISAPLERRNSARSGLLSLQEGQEGESGRSTPETRRRD